MDEGGRTEEKWRGEINSNRRKDREEQMRENDEKEKGRKERKDKWKRK